MTARGPVTQEAAEPTPLAVGHQHPIGDYAVIGDGRSVALIARDGAVEWLCWPRFDSPSWFGALLDRDHGGRFVVQPEDAYTATRRYVGDSNVLETTYRTATGVLRLTDCMPVTSERAKQRVLWPDHEILRRVECIAGEVVVRVSYEPRPNYAAATPRLSAQRRLGIYCTFGDQTLILRSDIPLTLAPDGRAAAGRSALRQGERGYLSLTFAHREPAVLAALGASADQRLAATARWWERWAEQCRYDGPYRPAVVRSALVLRLLAYAPSGAIVAAPTTSLPEWIGGERNWDYRYCWLRDASLTVQALHDLGFVTEAIAFLSWLIHTTRITWPELHVLYDVYGGHPTPEHELTHLAGYAGSHPVRVGNAAADQLQLDVYGEVIDAAYQLIYRGERIDPVTAQMLVGFGETVCRRWREPDAGIWEIRAGPRQHTYSKAMCWVALDRLIRLHDAGHLRLPRARFAAHRTEIKRLTDRQGFNDALRSFVSVFEGDDVDASLLQLGRHGFVDPADERMRGTLGLIETRLAAGPLLYRYRTTDGLPKGEHAFGITSFWAVTAKTGAGDVDGAAAAFEQLLRYANDVGLYAEEIDARSGAAVGNFPQAFTHVGLIDAALALQQGRRQPGAATPSAAPGSAIGRPATAGASAG